MAIPLDSCGLLLEEYRAYLETLRDVRIDPRLQARLSQSDVVQQTLIEAWQHVEHLQGLTPDGQRRYLRRMLVNNLLDRIDEVRAARRNPEREVPLGGGVEPVADDTSPSRRLMREEEGMKLLEAMTQLDERQRLALVLRNFHDCTLEEIARHMGCTVGAVAGLLDRALKHLRQRLPATE
jgi:RNA polymerase sigma-70 factor (ECF subfamily)